ncbi:MAG: hypothetical protein ACI8QS_001090 [Planctomycetota bacterium]|jgi:hypothetical protein
MKKISPKRAVLLIGASMTLALGCVEAALHFVPALVPASFRRTFPLHGVGFFHPDLLDDTAVEDMPLPLFVGSYHGPPPKDLVDIGLAPIEAAVADYARWGDVDIIVDEFGFPNLSIPEQADIILVGDSFGVSAGIEKPVGLAQLLRHELDLSIYNLGVASIGAFQERDLLLRHGLPKRPRVVIWMFFGGNDLTDALMTLYHQSEGRTTWGDVHNDHRPPHFRLLAILRHLRGRRIDAAQLTPLPGLRLETTGGSEEFVTWMLPGYLLALTRSREEWLADPAFAPNLEVLGDVSKAVEEAGAKLLFVYLPSKAQALLPVVEQNAPLIYEMANFQNPVPQFTPETLLPTARANASALEDLMREACEERGISFLSTTAILEEAARKGEPGYLRGDTHWDARGHRQVLPALTAAVRALMD